MKSTIEVWTWDPSVDVGSTSLIGYGVEATDGHIGKIDEMSTATGRGWFVVDTGFWIFGKKRLLPAATVRSVDHEAKKVFVSLTKDQVKDAPDFDAMRRDDSSYDDYGRYYGAHL